MADDAPGPRAAAEVPPAGLARAEAEAAKAVCRHFARRGACLFGDACAFSHDIEPGTRRPPAFVDARVSPGAAPPTPPPVPTFGARRRNVGNKAKCSVFRRWVLQTFGHAFLCSGAGVLDVAGGKGELAFELLNVSGVPVTVVDPRPMRLDTYARKFRAGFYHKNRAPAVVASVLRPADAPLAAPKHCRVYFFPDAWREPDLEKRRAATFASWRVAHETRWSRRGLVLDEGSEQGEEGSGGAMTFRDDVSNTSRSETGDGSDGDKNASTRSLSARYRARGDVARQRCLFETKRRELAELSPESTISSGEEVPFTKNEETTLGRGSDADALAYNTRLVPESMDADSTFSTLEQTLSDCSVVLGMHPDQATDAIVDFALEFGKPFAVVPCCTYSKEFPKRRRPPSPANPNGGGLVTTHKHLVEYLLAKAPGLCRTATLPFGGMNTVVYSLGTEPGQHETCAEIKP